MILKIDRLAVELPMPEQPDPDAAAAVQELLGGRFGEMSTLMNYTFQSFSGRDPIPRTARRSRGPTSPPRERRAPTSRPRPTLGIPGYDVGELAEVAKRMMSER
jgi:Manganese containing catalase